MPPARYNTESDLVKYLTDANLSIQTKQNYQERLKALEKLLQKPLFDILKHADASIETLRTTYPKDTTRKMYMSVILSLFRYVPNLKTQLKKAYEKWAEAFKHHDGAVEERYKTNAPTEKQLQGYVPYEEIKQKRFELPKGSIERLLLALYTDIYPLRADFNKVRLYKALPSNPEANYIKMTNNGCTLYLTEYKTANKHGTFVKELPESLCSEIHDSLETTPRDWLFINANKEPFENPNSFTHFTSRTLKRIFEKPLTISLIRHAFISTLDFNTLTIAEKEAIAKEMTHTTRLQDQYRLIFNKV